VLVRPSHPRATGSWDQAPVTVTVTTAIVRHVVAVPVDALLALSGVPKAEALAFSVAAQALVVVTGAAVILLVAAWQVAIRIRPRLAAAF